MECLDENTLLQLSHGLLVPDAAAQAEDHIAECGSCRRLLSEVVRTTTPPAIENSTVTAGETRLVSTRPARMTLHRGACVGRYVVLDCLGSGGMGVVYAAYDGELDRKVALKFLTTPDPTRLLREARSLARITHPNVVVLYEVDTFDGRVFAAMELVDGITLAEWLEAEPRGWREILRVFVEMGRGLAAVHASRLVHRDVKPSNVLIGRDGRARLSDFGLAGDPVDHAGERAGTPKYMAPEQRAGAADARSDQYSFCVAFDHALQGAPGWIRAVLARGSDNDPANRFPSMDALLHELTTKRDRIRRWWFAAAALIAVGLGAFGLSNLHDERRSCRGFDTRLTGVWDAEVKRRVERAFVTASGTIGTETWQRVAHNLDAFAARWSAMRTDVCEATHVRGEQSAELLDIRISCLDSRLEELRELTSLFQVADHALVLEAPKASLKLSSLDDCGKATTLMPLPPTANARRELAALQGELGKAHSVRYVRSGEALERTRKVVERARLLGYRPFEAEALLTLATLERDLDVVENALRDAIRAAQAGRDDLNAARAWNRLVFHVSYLQGRPVDAKEITKDAYAALERLGAGHDEVEAQLLAALGGEAAENLPRQQKALAIYERVRGSDHQDTALIHNNVGTALYQLGELAKATEHYRKALAIQERLFGPNHPTVAFTLNNLANPIADQGRHAEAIALWERARSIYLAADPRDPILILVLTNMGQTYLTLDRPHDALARFEEANAHETRRSDHAGIAPTLVGLGESRLALGHPELAVAPLERALALVESPAVPDAYRAEVQFTLSRALWDANVDRKRARGLAVAARSVLERTGDSTETARIDTWIGEHQLP